MSFGADSVKRRPPTQHSHGAGSSGPSGRDLKKIIGGALMAVGALFTLYGAGSGLAALVRVSLDNFGTMCILGLINFIFWSCVAPPFFPFGGLIANGICIAGGVLIFGGIPAIPGAIIAGGGALLFVNA